MADLPLAGPGHDPWTVALFAAADPRAAIGCGVLVGVSRKSSIARVAFPVAQRHTDSHFGMTYPLRAPNTPATARLVGEAIRKVFENLNQLDLG